jgi:hypothetical protein
MFITRVHYADKFILPLREWVQVQVNLFLLYFHFNKAAGTVPTTGSRKLDGENNAIITKIHVVQIKLRVLGAWSQK